MQELLLKYDSTFLNINIKAAVFNNLTYHLLKYFTLMICGYICNYYFYIRRVLVWFSFRKYTKPFENNKTSLKKRIRKLINFFLSLPFKVYILSHYF